MEFNKNKIVLVSTLSILLLSFQAEASWFPRVFKHVSSYDDDMNDVAAQSPSYAPGQSPVYAPAPESYSPSIAPAPESFSHSISSAPESSSPSSDPAPESFSPSTSPAPETFSLSVAAAPEYMAPATTPVSAPKTYEPTSSPPSTVSPLPKESSSLSGGAISNVKLPCAADSDVWSCVSDINSFLNGKEDQYSVLKIGIQAAIEQAKQVIVQAQENADGQGCKYDNAVDDLQESMKAVESHDMGKIISMLQAAQDDVSSCGDASVNEGLQSLIKNCLTIGEAVELTNLNF